MTKAQLRQEVIDRGYDYVKASRIDEAIQRAYREVCSHRPWPFLEETVEGEAPLTITDLGRIETVESATREALLRGSSRRWLLGNYSDLDASGGALYWYLEDDTLRTYPNGTDTLRVHYWKRPAVLGESDEPLVPAEYQYLIVDRVVVDLLKDDDEYEQARELRKEVREGLTEMAAELLHRNRQDARTILRTGQASDYA